MQIRQITDVIEKFAHPELQEGYDNAGLILGNKESEVEKILICIDITEDVLDEAIEKNCQLVISHHPLIFKGIKKINGKNSIERIIIKAIQKGIAIYAAHTNLDNADGGVNGMIADKLNLKNRRILEAKQDLLYKLVTFCPFDYADKVREAIFKSGAGNIGNYDSCSFNVDGEGSFRASENANPFVGDINKLHTEKEVRIETVFYKHDENQVIRALLQVHPYEEVAYDVYKLSNSQNTIGSGLIGEIDRVSEIDFLLRIKGIFKIACIKHSRILNKPIRKVAVCGGSGSFLINRAIAAGADIFITGDVKYHDFFDAENKIIIADIGHYESEQFTKELLYTIIIKNFPNFAVLISEKDTNPIYYL